MSEYAYLIKAKAKAGDAKNLFCWFSAKSDSRAEREILNILDDADIETGRGADYLLPVRTNLPVVDDLPEEGILDNTWCDRHELGDDGLTWQKIPVAVAITEPVDPAPTANHTEESEPGDGGDDDGTITYEQTTLTQRVLGAWLYGSFTKLFAGQRQEIALLNLDTDATYPQNLLLALNGSTETQSLRHGYPQMLFDLVAAIKAVWPADGKAPAVNNLLAFANEWIGARYNASASGDARADVTAKWQKKTSMTRTDAGTNAGGGNPTDRNPELKHDLDVLDIEVSLALEPATFDIYNVPGPEYRRSQETISHNEPLWRAWSQHLRKTPGILDFSRAAIFALIRNAPAPAAVSDMSHYINTNLNEADHANPSLELLRQAGHVPSSVQASAGSEPSPAPVTVAETIPDVEIPTAAPAAPEQILEIASHEPMETHDDVQIKAEIPVSADEGADDANQKADAITLPSTVVEAAAAFSGALKKAATALPLVCWTSLMIDLETFGSNPSAPIVSVGALFFDPQTGELGPDLYQVIDLESSMALGCQPDASTILWWMKQSAEARAALASDYTNDISGALWALSDFIHQHGGDGVQVWGNGATFDNVILRESYRRADIECPWKYWNDRDVRTLVEMGKAAGIDPRRTIPFNGDQHNALHDTYHQARYVSAIWQHFFPS